jgi:hypothetical protein
LRCNCPVNVAVDTELSCVRNSSVSTTGRGGSSDDIGLVKHDDSPASLREAHVRSLGQRLLHEGVEIALGQLAG